MQTTYDFLSHCGVDRFSLCHYASKDTQFFVMLVCLAYNGHKSIHCNIVTFFELHRRDTGICIELFVIAYR